VDEGPEVTAGDPAVDVLGSELDPIDEVDWRMTVGQRLSGVAGRDTQQRRIVGVTAHHAMQYYDISGDNRVRFVSDVEESARHAVSHPSFVEYAGGLGLVVLRNLEIGHMRGAPAKQLDLEVAHAAADLQDRSTRDPARLNVVDYCPRRGGQSSALIPLRCTSGEAA
jgi:hypothetical protein